MKYKWAFLLNYCGKIIPEIEKMAENARNGVPQNTIQNRGQWWRWTASSLSFPSDRIPENPGQHIIHRKQIQDSHSFPFLSSRFPPVCISLLFQLVLVSYHFPIGIPHAQEPFQFLSVSPQVKKPFHALSCRRRILWVGKVSLGWLAVLPYLGKRISNGLETHC